MDYLKQKWGYWFTTLDVNHDGVLSRADVDLTLQNFPIIEGLSEKEGKVADDYIEEWWKNFILRGRDNISKEEFVNRFEKEYTEDKKAFIERMTALVKFIVPVLDVDHADGLSSDRFIKDFKTWGHENFSNETLNKAFEMFKPKDGIIPLKRYEDDWVRFFTSEDPSKPDVVLAVYKAGYL